MLLVLVLLPLALRATWRARLAWGAAFVVPAVVLVGGWAIHNGIRYDNYTIARGGNATVPFFRAFVTDKIVRPSNGPASRELAAAVQRDLLTKEPTAPTGSTLDEFFSEASPRMQVDLLALSDRLKGWKSNYRWLRDVGVEAVARIRRGTHAESRQTFPECSVWRSTARRPRRPSAATGPTAAPTVTVKGRTLPEPSEGEPIPAAHEGGVTTPDGSIYTVWTSPSEHHLVFVHPGAEQRYIALHRRMGELPPICRPHRERRPCAPAQPGPPAGSPAVVLARARAGCARFSPVRGGPALWTPTVAGLIVIVLTALGLPAEPHYSVPVAPAFVLLASGMLFARGASSRPRPGGAPSSRSSPACPASRRRCCRRDRGAWALQKYISTIHGAFTYDQAPHDLAVFLSRPRKGVHGASPVRVSTATQTYAYPPLLAFLAAPFHPLRDGIATLLWTLLSLAAIAGALWLLGLRDWRCYALTAAYPFTRSAIGLGHRRAAAAARCCGCLALARPGLRVGCRSGRGDRAEALPLAARRLARVDGRLRAASSPVGSRACACPASPGQ